MLPLWKGREARIVQFEAEVDGMNDFVTAFGNISRGRELAAGLTAFNMLSHAASFKNRAAANGVLDAAIVGEGAFEGIATQARQPDLRGRHQRPGTDVFAGERVGRAARCGAGD